jgi:hypothetical protein
MVGDPLVVSLGCMAQGAVVDLSHRLPKVFKGLFQRVVHASGSTANN